MTTESLYEAWIFCCGSAVVILGIEKSSVSKAMVRNNLIKLSYHDVNIDNRFIYQYKKNMSNSLKERNDSLARQLNKITKGNKCERCPKSGEHYALEWAHIKTRSILSMRWVLLNCLLFCKECHEWSHKNEKKRDEWIEEKFPGRLKALQIMKNGRSATMDYIQMKKWNKILKDQIQEETILARKRGQLV
jgi:hypothetical protein